ncbi:hypothetical protein [Teichococcus aestuarii]|uniref:hypothetical protein n=1 Tax=Teichococcus aestuarii TaxID=568898 RepID=UPI00361409F1
MSAPLSAGISIREFARREGCNDKLVRRAINGGFLGTLPDGSLDPALVGSGWRKANRHADKAADTSADTADMSAPPVRTVRAPVSAPAGVLEEREEQPRGGALRRQRRPEEPEDGDDEDLDLDEFARQVLGGRTPTLAVSERAKQAALALKQVLAAQQAANALVELAVAQTVLFKTTRQARDAWMNWPTRIGPLLAADLGLEAAKVVEALTPYVQQQLEALGEPEADFTSPED